jgi:hypothetical protein
MTLTPEDFSNNPELAEIFGAPDTNANFQVVLESNQHFEAMQNQYALIDLYNNLLVDLINQLNFLYPYVEPFISPFL